MSTNATEYRVYKTLDFHLTQAAINEIDFAVNPSAAQTITLNGTVVTFVASGATGNQVNIGSNLGYTMVALAAFLNASADAQISKCFYWAGSLSLLIVFKTEGASGNTFTVASSNGTLAFPSTLTYGTTWNCVSITAGQVYSAYNQASRILAKQVALKWARTILASPFATCNISEPLVGGGRSQYSTTVTDGLSENGFYYG